MLPAVAKYALLGQYSCTLFPHLIDLFQLPFFKLYVISCFWISSFSFSTTIFRSRYSLSLLSCTLLRWVNSDISDETVLSHLHLGNQGGVVSCLALRLPNPLLSFCVWHNGHLLLCPFQRSKLWLTPQYPLTCLTINKRFVWVPSVRAFDYMVHDQSKGCSLNLPECIHLSTSLRTCIWSVRVVERCEEMWMFPIQMV